MSPSHLREDAAARSARQGGETLRVRVQRLDTRQYLDSAGRWQRDPAWALVRRDRAISGIHYIAFHARERDGVKGFEIRVGGGTSIMPRIAPTISGFATADDGEYMKVAEAVFRIFDRQDWLRVNRARARIKVLVDKIGIEEMRALVDEEVTRLLLDEALFPDVLVVGGDVASRARQVLAAIQPG